MNALADQRLHDWIRAQEALLAAPSPDWEDCARVLEGLTDLAADLGCGRVDPTGIFGTAVETETKSFAAVHARLQSEMLKLWIEASAQLCRQPQADPRAAIRAWGRALDQAFSRLMAQPGHLELQIAWLREARAAGVPLNPPGLSATHLPTIGTTPKDAIWRDGVASLHRYVRETPAYHPPMVIVHGLIGRQTMVDLGPGQSLVEDLLQRGLDLWVMDWGNPSGADAALGVRDYVAWVDRAVREVEAETGQKPLLFGICQGGLFTLCHAALYPGATSGVIVTGTPVDFHADMAAGEGFLNRLARRLPDDEINALIEPTGMLPGNLTGFLFQAMTPGRTLVKYSVDMLDRADDRASLGMFLAMEAWLADRPDLPGAAAREWLFDLYRENRLISGEFTLGPHMVDLRKITGPVLNIIGRRDHIVPPACSRALGDYLDRPKYSEVETDSGHIGVLVSSSSRQRVARHICDWLIETGQRGG